MKGKITIHVRGVEKNLLLKVKIEAITKGISQGEVINSALKKHFKESIDLFESINPILNTKED